MASETNCIVTVLAFLVRPRWTKLKCRHMKIPTGCRKPPVLPCSDKTCFSWQRHSDAVDHDDTAVAEDMLNITESLQSHQDKVHLGFSDAVGEKTSQLKACLFSFITSREKIFTEFFFVDILKLRRFHLTAAAPPNFFSLPLLIWSYVSHYKASKWWSEPVQATKSSVSLSVLWVGGKWAELTGRD